MKKDTFQNRLIEGMRIRNMSQAELARRTGMSRGRINHYTTGLYEAKQDGVYLIAKALGVSEAWLMGYDVPMEPARAEDHDDNGESDLLEAYRALSPEGQVLALDYLRMLESRYGKKNHTAAEAV